jgi:exopolyphosphatase/guanosine-5'-triphosphate,3'-diphosphate pyrophosphatase
MTHPERAFLAITLFARHTAAAPALEPEVLSRTLTPERLRRARALGAAMRLGCDLCGRNPELLPRSTIDIVGEVIVLDAEPRWADMLLGEQTAKRAATLADHLELGLKIGR